MRPQSKQRGLGECRGCPRDYFPDLLQPVGQNCVLRDNERARRDGALAVTEPLGRRLGADHARRRGQSYVESIGRWS